jgi:hypothetical protein
MTTTAAPQLLCSDPIGGTMMVSEGMVYYVSSCCGASAKGSVNSYTGVCCRKCYQAIPASTGMAWMANDDQAWAAYAEKLRPELERFTDDMVSRVREAARKASGL